GGLAYMNYSVSDTAEYGNYTRGPRVINAQVKQEMKKILAEIQDGTFAREWLKECDEGWPNMSQLRKASQEHPIEVIGKQLRKMMAWLKPRKKSDTAASPIDAEVTA
ncbi:MAG TPA: ketol-acid reductoisomerase, partial [Rhodothermales bacterium]